MTCLTLFVTLAVRYFSFLLKSISLKPPMVKSLIYRLESSIHSLRGRVAKLVTSKGYYLLSLSHYIFVAALLIYAIFIPNENKTMDPLKESLQRLSFFILFSHRVYLLLNNINISPLILFGAMNQVNSADEFHVLNYFLLTFFVFAIFVLPAETMNELTYLNIKRARMPTNPFEFALFLFVFFHMVEFALITMCFFLACVTESSFFEIKFGELSGLDVSDECSICQNVIMSHEIVRVRKCKHIFHKECIDQWVVIKNECPMCRRSPPTDGESLKEIAEPIKISNEGYFIWSK